MRCDRIWTNAHLATCAPDRAGLGEVARGLIAARAGRILYAGPMHEAPAFEAAERVDCEGRLVMPGLIDCHTHLIYAGDRAHEFEMRLNGVSYEDIARAGGGIAATVKATRAASEVDLIEGALPRLDALIGEGATTVEVKSGYGLSFEHETKQLRAARALESRRDISIVTTFLGAHALPPGETDKDAYIDYIASMIPEIAREGLAEAVDAFCETIAFSPAQVARVFDAAKQSGLRVKLHADQLSDSHGAALAAAFGALSADHIEHADEAGIAAMANAGTVAVLLPGAFYFLRDSHVPPIALLRHYNVAIALATDCNPGTSPLTSLLLAMNMGATLFHLTVEECALGVTRNAARALGLDDRGTLEKGKRCDLAVWNVERPAELVYRIGFNPLHARVWNGR